MKILKRVEPVGGWRKVVKCNHCYSILELMENDVRWHGNYVSKHPHDPEGDLVNEEFRYTCAVCGYSSKVEIPEYLQVRKQPKCL